MDAIASTPLILDEFGSLKHEALSHGFVLGYLFVQTMLEVF